MIQQHIKNAVTYIDFKANNSRLYLGHSVYTCATKSCLSIKNYDTTKRNGYDYDW